VAPQELSLGYRWVYLLERLSTVRTTLVSRNVFGSVAMLNYKLSAEI
jgi:hypothetical protein